MNSAPVWDQELINRYNHSGPRYTSYPTAVQFDGHFDIQQYHQSAIDSANAIKPLSLYVHIPFCSHVCFYCACNKIVTSRRARANIYLQHLYREIEMQGKLFSQKQPVEQLHFGGGTPTFLNQQQLTELMAHIGKHFQLARYNQGDYAIELDPREVDWPMMNRLRECGFNRVSLGIQDLDTKVQAAVNRVQPDSMVQSVVDAARTMAFKSIHMDLIYGLPLQTPRSFMATIDRVIDMLPDRLSLFNYAHLPHRFKPQRRINVQDLPDPTMKLEILQQATSRLLAQGYIYIGMDHFALPDDELAIARETRTLHRNFQGYTTHRHCDLVGLGISAISQVGDTYSQNSTDETGYYAMINESRLPVVRGWKMNDDDKIRRAVISQLICHFQLQISDIEQRFGIIFREYFSRELDKLKPMMADGLLKLNDDGILEVLPRGVFLIRNICMQFDGYLKQQQANAGPLFSKVI